MAGRPLASVTPRHVRTRPFLLASHAPRCVPAPSPLAHMAPGAATPARQALPHPLGSSRLGPSSRTASSTRPGRLAATRAARRAATTQHAVAAGNGTSARADGLDQGERGEPGAVGSVVGRVGSTDAYSTFDAQLLASRQAASTLAAEVSALAAKAGQRVSGGAAVAGTPVAFGAAQTSSGARVSTLPCLVPCARRSAMAGRSRPGVCFIQNRRPGERGCSCPGGRSS